MDNHHSHVGIYVAIGVSSLVTILATAGVVWGVDYHNQLSQIGGRENYKSYKEMINHPKFAEGNKANIEAQIAQMNGEAPKGQDPAPAPAPTTGTLTPDEIAGLTKDVYVRGNTGADILWIEYSDLECIFCKKLHDSGAISNIAGKYGDKLAFAFKHFPLGFHPAAMPAAQAAECVGETGGSAKYYDFVEGVFKKGTPDQTTIDTVVKEIGLDAIAIKKCVDSGKYAAKVNAQMDEGSKKFDVNGTPGNVLINTKNGKYEIVSGAQPEANFQAAIDRLMAS